MKTELKLPIKIDKTYYTKDGRGEPYVIHGATLESKGWSPDIEERDSENDITHEEWEPKDNELVWCWDEDEPAATEIRFYDAENKCTFYKNGDRNGPEFDHYAPFIG